MICAESGEAVNHACVGFLRQVEAALQGRQRQLREAGDELVGLYFAGRICVSVIKVNDSRSHTRRFKEFVKSLFRGYLRFPSEDLLGLGVVG